MNDAGINSDDLAIILNKLEQLERLITTRFDTVDAKLRKQSAEDEQQNESLKIRRLLIEYLKKNIIRDESDLQVAAFNYRPFIKDGLIHLFLNDFKRYLQLEHGIDKEKPELVSLFNLLNIKHAVVKALDPSTKKRTSRSAFILPSSWVVLVEKPF